MCGAGRIGGATEYTYDANNQMLTVKNPRLFVHVVNEYDDDGRVWRQTQQDGGLWVYSYTEDANRVCSSTWCFTQKGVALAGIVGLIGNLVQYLAQQAITGEEITLGDATWNALLGLLAGAAAFALGPVIARKIVELLPVPTTMGRLTRSGRRNAESNQLVDRMMRPLTQGIWGFLTGACSNVPRPGN